MLRGLLPCPYHLGSSGECQNAQNLQKHRFWTILTHFSGFCPKLFIIHIGFFVLKNPLKLGFLTIFTTCSQKQAFWPFLATCQVPVGSEKFYCNIGLQYFVRLAYLSKTINVVNMTFRNLIVYEIRSPVCRRENGHFHSGS